jgi:chromosome partitioning protein
MAPRVTAVINQKGGAGKTTLAVNLAAGLSLRGSTLLLDLDPQGSALQWASQGGSALPMPVQPGPASGDWAPLRRQHAALSHLVLDCPPSLGDAVSKAALRHCDLVLVPVLPSPVDLWASLRLPEEIEQARRQRPQLRAWLVLNQVEPRSALSAAMHAAMAEFGLPVLRSRLQRRAVYRSAALDGVSVYQMGARGAAAVAEFEALIQEVYTA